MADIDPSAEERARILRDLLDDLLRQRQSIEAQLVSGTGQRECRDLVQLAATFAATICGPCVLSNACDAPRTGEREIWLQALQQRLELAAPLLNVQDADSTEPFSIRSVIAEIHAIRMGDDPQLFARLPRRKLAWRSRIGKWRALYLDALGDGLGIPESDRHRFIAEAYSTSWDTIRKWEDQPPGSTPQQGRAQVSGEDELARARRQGRWNRGGLTRADWEQAVHTAAEIYREERRTAAGQST